MPTREVNFSSLFPKSAFSHGTFSLKGLGQDTFLRHRFSNIHIADYYIIIFIAFQIILSPILNNKSEYLLQPPHLKIHFSRKSEYRGWQLYGLKDPC